MKRNKIFSKFAIAFINFYKNGISPLFCNGAVCRFTPTCSEYTKQAIKKYGLRKGLHLGIKRISKCHPKGEFGYDPVP